MPAFVIDASVAIAGLAPDENHAGAINLVDRAIAEGAIAPMLFAYEIANILATKQRRGTLSQELRDEIARAVGDMAVELEHATLATILDSVALLAMRNRLTIYDAAYLELAKRKNLPLATLDKDLANSGRREGVVVLGLD